MPKKPNTRKNIPKRIRTKSPRRLSLREELMSVDRQCSVAIAQTGAALQPLIVLNKSHKHFAELVDLSSIVSRDLKEMSMRLHDIRQSIPVELRRSNNDHMLLAVESNGRYQEWNEEFSNVLMPNIDTITSLLTDRGDLTTAGEVIIAEESLK